MYIYASATPRLSMPWPHAPTVKLYQLQETEYSKVTFSERCNCAIAAADVHQCTHWSLHVCSLRVVHARFCDANDEIEMTAAAAADADAGRSSCRCQQCSMHAASM